MDPCTERGEKNGVEKIVGTIGADWQVPEIKEVRETLRLFHNGNPRRERKGIQEKKAVHSTKAMRFKPGGNPPGTGTSP